MMLDRLTRVRIMLWGSCLGLRGVMASGVTGTLVPEQALSDLLSGRALPTTGDRQMLPSTNVLGGRLHEKAN
jgi:hypothetical protein